MDGREPRFVQGLNLAAINAETDRRGFIPVNERMQVLDKAGKPLPSVYCIGDANGELQLTCNNCPMTGGAAPTTSRELPTVSGPMNRGLRAGKYMLAHAASAQGISAVENMCQRPHVLNHNSVPAACFTHPEVRLPPPPGHSPCGCWQVTRHYRYLGQEVPTRGWDAGQFRGPDRGGGSGDGSEGRVC